MVYQPKLIISTSGHRWIFKLHLSSFLRPTHSTQVGLKILPSTNIAISPIILLSCSAYCHALWSSGCCCKSSPAQTHWFWLCTKYKGKPSFHCSQEVSNSYINLPWQIFTRVKFSHFIGYAEVHKSIRWAGGSCPPLVNTVRPNPLSSWAWFLGGRSKELTVKLLFFIPILPPHRSVAPSTRRQPVLSHFPSEPHLCSRSGLKPVWGVLYFGGVWNTFNMPWNQHKSQTASSAREASVCHNTVLTSCTANLFSNVRENVFFLFGLL